MSNATTASSTSRTTGSGGGGSSSSSSISSSLPEQFIADVAEEYFAAETEDFPSWYTQLYYPCLPPPSMQPQQPHDGTEPFFYMDAFYHRVCRLMAKAVDAAAVTGDVLYVGSNIGGGVPILRQYLPHARRIFGIDLVPGHVRIAQARHGHLAEFLLADVLELDRRFAPGSFQLVFDEACISHFRLEYAYLFAPAVRQLRRALQPDGVLVTSGCCKLEWTVERAIASTEAEGFDCLRVEDWSKECGLACVAMLRHALGRTVGGGGQPLGALPPPAIPYEEQLKYPVQTSELIRVLQHYLRTSSDGSKPLVGLVFRRRSDPGDDDGGGGDESSGIRRGEGGARREPGLPLCRERGEQQEDEEDEGQSERASEAGRSEQSLASTEASEAPPTQPTQQCMTPLPL